VDQLRMQGFLTENMTNPPKGHNHYCHEIHPAQERARFLLDSFEINVWKTVTQQQQTHPLEDETVGDIDATPELIGVVAEALKHPGGITGNFPRCPVGGAASTLRHDCIRRSAPWKVARVQKVGGRLQLPLFFGFLLLGNQPARITKPYAIRSVGVTIAIEAITQFGSKGCADVCLEKAAFPRPK
jgi:hypothetical protein